MRWWFEAADAVSDWIGCHGVWQALLIPLVDLTCLRVEVEASFVELECLQVLRSGFGLGRGCSW